MAESSGKRKGKYILKDNRATKRKQSTKEKGSNLVYERDEDSDDDLIDFSFLDFEADKFKPSSTLCEDPFLNELCDENMLKNTYFEGGEEKYEHGDQEEHAGIDDETELEVGVEYRVHDPSMKWNKMKPEVGELYESPAQLRFALTNYAVANGYQLWFMKSDTNRIIARCGRKEAKNVCPFRVYASWKYNERTFQIKSMVETHLCSRNYKFGSLVTCNWIAKHYLKDIIRKPKMTLNEMKEDILRNYSVEVSRGQCHRARVKAREMIEGKLEDHYAKIWDYAHEIVRSNPGSTCKVGVTVNPDGKNYFKRFYVCFKALKDGWKKGCRRVIGLDGTFLKGQIKGEILTAIGRDADNHVYPIAWAVVDIENKDNWTWFLELLVDDLAIEGGRGLVVISDQHKGLLEAVKTILPHGEHRQCARHIYANFKKTYTGVELRNLFWAAATSSVEGDFLAKMEEIKKITPNGYEWLIARNPASWCMAFFSERFACEAVENGVCESFNGVIKDIRKKPLITMLEEIRIYLMGRFYFMADACTTWKTQYCPTIIEKMEKLGKDMRLWKVIASGGSVFETRFGYASYKVALDAHYCTCRFWEISGIPCVHAQAAINHCHLNPADFLSTWFTVEKYEAAYSSNILPVNGSNLWAQTEYQKPLPPLVRRMPGRPKTKRGRHPSEGRDEKYRTVRVKVSRTVRCTRCLTLGHNMKSCKNEQVTKDPPPSKKTGRPRRDGEGPSVRPKQPDIRGKRVKMMSKRGGKSTSTSTRVEVQVQETQVPETQFQTQFQVQETQVPETQVQEIEVQGTQFEDEVFPDQGGEAEGVQDVPVQDEVFPNEGVPDVQDVPVQIPMILHEADVRNLEESGYTADEILQVLQGAIVLPDPLVEEQVEEAEMIDPPEEQPIEEGEEPVFVPDPPLEAAVHQDVEAQQPQGQPAYMQAVQVANQRRRKPSEKIRKMRKTVFDKDGAGSSKEKAFNLDE